MDDVGFMVDIEDMIEAECRRVPMMTTQEFSVTSWTPSKRSRTRRTRLEACQDLLGFNDAVPPKALREIATTIIDAHAALGNVEQLEKIYRCLLSKPSALN